MEELTVKIAKNIIENNHARSINYVVYRGEKAISTIKVKLPEVRRPEKSDKIIKSSQKFVNGYKIVQTENGEYGYIDEENNELLPYRYDLALDFNQYGYAIVGKDGNVTWINKKFEHLNIIGKMVKDYSTEKSWTKTDGWLKVSEFSKGNMPLSRVYDNKTKYGELVAYFNTSGELQEFYHYDNPNDDDFPKTYFIHGTSFDESDTATAENYLLLARGYFMTYSELVNFCKQNGITNIINENINKKLLKK